MMGRLAAAVLFGVKPTDPLALALARGDPRRRLRRGVRTFPRAGRRGWIRWWRWRRSREELGIRD